MSPAPTRLVAVRLPLDPGPTIDPFALAGSDGMVFQHDGRVVVGLGCARAVDLPHGLDSAAEVDAATAVLSEVRCDDRFDTTTSGVLGFGALPFERSDPASLTVPEVIYGREPSGQEWVTVIADRPDRLPTQPGGLRSWLSERMTAPPGPGADPPPPPRIAPLTTDDSFRAMVAGALSLIGRGRLAKVVLARQVDVTMADTVDIADLLRRWHRLEPDCAVFSMPGADGQFVGASPELLVERSGTRVHCRPLAGTTDRLAGTPGSVLPAELLGSRKDGREHHLVVEAIRQALEPLCTELATPSSPDLVHLHNITHLGTSMNGTLAPDPEGSVPSALQLVAALHPTPAVGGVPTREARSVIADLEPRSRGNYAGPVGYVDGAGDGKWMLGIRSMSVNGRVAHLAAGVGIVEGSSPDVELAETNLKLTAVFHALAPGVPFSTTGPSITGDTAATSGGRRQAVS
jgi:menaquinone-specific isochorismate synthase